MEASFLVRMTFSALLCLLLSSAVLGRRAVLYEATPTDYGKVLSANLAGQGFEVVRAGSAELPAVLTSRPDLLVLPDSRRFPASSVPPLMDYLRAGGCLLAVGGPAFEDLLVERGGQWISSADVLKQASQNPPDVMLFAFNTGDERTWTRVTDQPKGKSSLTAQGGVLSARLESLPGWDVRMSPELTSPFSADKPITVLEARGEGGLSRLNVEWREKDGSRWRTQVPIGRGWQRFAFAPSDFHHATSGGVDGRGRPGDHFHPENAVRFCLGATSEGGRAARGAQQWWVRDVGFSADPCPEARMEAPVLDTISPVWKTSAMRDVRLLKARGDQLIVDSLLSLKGGFQGCMPVWRARCLGFADGASPERRFIPVVDAFGRGGAWRGTAAWLLVHFGGEFKGGVWAGVGVDPARLNARQKDALAALAAQMAARMFGYPFLRCAGSDEFAVSAAGRLRVGARAEALRSDAGSLSCRLTLVNEGRQYALTELEPKQAGAGASVEWAMREVPFQVAQGETNLVTELLAGEQPVDMLCQPISVLTAASRPASRICVKDGVFQLDGKVFFANGVNYWPRYIVAVEPAGKQGTWLSRARYDPEIIERDLELLESLKVNVVSTDCSNPADSPQLVDFLERCRRHGIYVKLSLPAYPLRPNLSAVKRIIEGGRLAGNSRLFACDLAWEPKLGRASRRQALDGQWRDWIQEQYGGLAQAERSWGCAANLDSSGQPTGPSDEQLQQDGEWRRMVAAYRRFADDIISRGYGRVARAIRALDPECLLTARTGFGGTGQARTVPLMPFDLGSGAAHLDFISPETYGLSGDLDNYLAAGFTTEYGRWVSGGKPVFWAEFGRSVPATGATPEALAAQAKHYRDCCEMFGRSHSSGWCAWWFPGGRRVEEGSDFGIMEQDGEARPAGEALRDCAARAARTARPPRAAGTVAIDRDAHVDGYAGVWRVHREEYLAAIRRGHRLALSDECEGRTSRDCPPVAVGGAPWRDGAPPKCLNAEISAVEVLAWGGQWVPAGEGCVRVPRGQPLNVRATVVNTGRVRWLKDAGGEGDVVLQAAGGGFTECAPPAQDVDVLQTCGVAFRAFPSVTQKTSVALRMLCRGRGEFGQRVTIEVEPQD